MHEGMHSNVQYCRSNFVWVQEVYVFFALVLLVLAAAAVRLFFTGEYSSSLSSSDFSFFDLFDWTFFF